MPPKSKKAPQQLVTPVKVEFTQTFDGLLRSRLPASIQERSQTAHGSMLKMIPDRVILPAHSVDKLSLRRDILQPRITTAHLVVRQWAQHQPKDLKKEI